MLSEAFFGCQRHKNIVNYTIFTRGHYQKKMKIDQKSTKKRPTRTSKTHLQILPSFFPPRTPKNVENPSRLKDFRGGSAAGARPRVAKAMLSCHTLHGEASPDLRAAAPAADPGRIGNSMMV